MNLQGTSFYTHFIKWLTHAEACLLVLSQPDTLPNRDMAHNAHIAADRLESWAHALWHFALACEDDDNALETITISFETIEEENNESIFTKK